MDSGRNKDSSFFSRCQNKSRFSAKKTSKRGWIQEQLAPAIGSSQSRIAKLEGGDPGISLDLMIKALLWLGTSKKQIGKILEGDLEPA